MKNFVNDFKNEWKKPNNIVVRLILINVIVWLVIRFVAVFTSFSGSYSISALLENTLYLNADLSVFAWRPWTLLSYSFTHFDFTHILFNMLMLYWFGMLLRNFIGSHRTLAIYILGAIAGGVTFLFLYNVLPAVSETLNLTNSGVEKNLDIFRGVKMLGASGSVYAMLLALATLRPNTEMHLLLIGPVKLKYIALVAVLLSFFALIGVNKGGEMAHLGGALMGYIFAFQYQKGRDMSKPITSLIEQIQLWFSKKPVMKASTFNSKKKKTKSGKGYKAQDYTTSKTNAQKQRIIDEILDKISASGYESLTQEEKQILFQASQN